MQLSHQSNGTTAWAEEVIHQSDGSRKIGIACVFIRNPCLREAPIRLWSKSAPIRGCAGRPAAAALTLRM